MKKKYIASSEDKKDWVDFTKQIDNIIPKEVDISRGNIKINKVPKLDLHGSSLNESNKMVKKFIIQSFRQGYKKLLLVTGKGLRSKFYNNPYVSERLNILRYAVPEYIKNDEDLKNKISRILKADIKDGGEGAMYIFLKNNKKVIG